MQYWNERYKDAQAEISNLQTKQVELEREIEELKSKRIQSMSFELVSVSRSKRKRDPSVESSASASKRVKAANDSSTKKNQLYEVLDEDFGPLGTTTYGNNSLQSSNILSSLTKATGAATVHHLWNVHKSYKQLHSDPSVLAYHLTRTCCNLTLHVASVAKNCREQQFQSLEEDDKRIRDIRLANVERELARTQRAAGRTFVSLMHGLTAFHDAQSDIITSRQGAVIYSYLQGFDTILTVISTTLNLVVHQAEEDESQARAKPGPKSKSKVRPPESVSSSLTTLLLAIMASLDSKQRSHMALFEGLVYLLLSRVGKQLFFFTFRHDRCTTVEGDITLGYPEISDTAAEPSQRSSSPAKLKAMKVEAKYLVQLLERAMALAPSFLGSTLSDSAIAKLSRVTTTTRRATASKTAMTKSALSAMAKEKLQHTLIDAMFGEDGAQNEFIERLTKPKAFAPIPPPPKVEDEDVPSWFCEQVWRLVGWDLLALEGGF